MKNKKFLLLILFFVFWNCAAFTRVSPQSNSDSIIIGISINISRSVIQQLYFIKLDENDSYLSNKEIIPANFNVDDKFYLLNAEPGRYIIIAGYKENVKSSSTRRTTYYFPMKFIKLSDITVSKGNIYYLGDYYLWFSPSLSWGIDKPDEAQSFYCKRFQPNKLNPTIASVAEDVLDTYVGSLFNSAESDSAIAVNLDENKKSQLTEVQFWENTLKGLKGNLFQRKLFTEQLAMNEEWENIINKKLHVLKNKETK
jgi:hypothetical protein